MIEDAARARSSAERPVPGPSRLPHSAAGSRRIPHLFDRWEEFAERVRRASTVRLFLDFDGTLVNLRPLPGQVRLTKKARAALRKLVRRRYVRVAIVSGRRRSSLIRHVRVSRIRFYGLYGWETGSRCRVPARARANVSLAREVLAGLPQEIPEIRLEDKGISLAFHFRGASAEAQRRARLSIRRHLARFGGGLRLLRTTYAWELVPGQIRGKGAAVRRVLSRAPRGTLAIFLGDDISDEPAFAAARRVIGVLVGSPRPTNARFGLRNPEEVCEFLQRLDAELAGS